VFSLAGIRRRRPTVGLGATFLASALGVAAPAAAQSSVDARSLVLPADATPPGGVEVTIEPKGKPWSVGSHGGWECDPACVMRVKPDSYLVTIDETKTTFLFQVPTQVIYDPGAPRLRTIAGWTAVGGVGVGGVLVGLGIYGYLQTCKGNGCPSFTVSRPAAGALVGTAAALVSVSVAGAIVFAVSSPSIRFRELEAIPELRRKKPFDVLLRPASQGASLDVLTTF
jgi:hypothetical protein